MFTPISFQTISSITKLAIQNGLFEDPNSCVVFYDMKGLLERLEEIRSIFPPRTLHAIAMKANPLLSIQKQIAALGFASEVTAFQN